MNVIEVDEYIYNDEGEEVGSITVAIFFTRNQLHQWLEEQGADPSILDNINDEDLLPVAVLEGINVDEEYRGQGYGNEGMDLFFDQANIYDTNSRLLIADLTNSNVFNLIKWYENYGFQEIGRTHAGDPVMLE